MSLSVLCQIDFLKVGTLGAIKQVTTFMNGSTMMDLGYALM